MGKKLLELYSKNPYYQLGLLAFLLILYIFTKVSMFGVLFAVALVATVALEIWLGSKKHGWKGELKDTAISLAGIVVLWFALTIILNTSVPINAVVSCSMLPNVERGDLILVQGAEPLGYEIDLSEQELSALQSHTSTVTAEGLGSFELQGSLYSYCVQHKDEVCTLFASSPGIFSEQKGPFTFNYGECIRESEEVSLSTPCIHSVDFKGETYYTNLSHDTIVYAPPSGDLYSYTGDIIHRLFFKIRSGGETYYLTKGDNNPMFDVQAYDYSAMLGNNAPSSGHYKGKILFKVPFLGYPKLFISGFYAETANCGSTLEYPSVS
ncbi:hypothetical protein GF412_00480 [Candidatus Micrarchaeota archaeon]|nr:hypothetical protein [Candidatus Micrarchaeota archaeon]MBD3417451.1 hypothetical protein [Candidatus Micrarchaeota archaeon]